MILLLAGLLLAIFAGLLTGGSLFALESIRLKLDWLLLAGMVGLALRPRVTVVGSVQESLLLGAWLLIAGTSVLVCAANRSVPWLWLVALGLSANMLVVSFNRGMPVLVANAPMGSTAAATAAIESSWLHRAFVSGTRFPLLADVMPLSVMGRAWGMASLGDLLIALGAAAALFALLHRSDCAV